MQIETDLFGVITYTESEVITFPDGLYGFEQYKQFLLIDIAEMPYKSLQSLDSNELAFTVTTPFAFVENYDFEISDYIIDQLSISSIDEMDIYVMIVFAEQLIDSSMNLKAPLVINSVKRIGKQVILNEEYPLKHKFFTHPEA